MELTIARIVKETEVQGKFGMQTRSAFTTNETGEKILSAFSKFPLKVGQTLTGEIKEVEKDGKTYHNFEFAKKAQGGGLTPVQEHQLKSASEMANACNTNILMLRQLLEEAGVTKKPESKITGTDVKYPEPGVDDIDPDDIPF